MNSSRPQPHPTQARLDAAERAHLRASGSGLGDIAIYVQTRNCHTLMNERLGRILAPYGLTNLGYFTMMAICARPENLANPSELCELIGETRGNMTRICDDLVAKGWMRRVPNPEDRRRVDLSLTDEGMKLLNVVAPMGRESANEFFRKTFTAEEKATLQGLLRRFAEALAQE